MITGHFALAAAAKARTPEVPLWALVVACQLLDVAFIPLLLTGQETIVALAPGYGGALIHADYTHSIIGTTVLALLAAIPAGLSWGRRAGAVVGAIVASHWLLDLIVHRPDLPVLPGNAFQLPLLGLGLWRVPAASMVVEAALVVAASVLYAQSFRQPSTAARAAVVLLSVGLGLFLLLDVAGIG